MANVKLSEKELLEKLQAQIVLSRGEKLSQQELLDRCIRFSTNHLEEFIRAEIDSPPITKEKIECILSNTVKTGYAFPEKSDDELIYNQ